MLVRTAYFDEAKQLRYRFDRTTDRRTLMSGLEHILPAGSRVVEVVIVKAPDIDAAALRTA